MHFGGSKTDAAAKGIFHRCLDAGINLFDTADVYNAGRSEVLLGRLITPVRNEVIVATKAYFSTGNGPNARGASRYHLIRAVEASLKRLGTDRIDIFYLHRHDDHMAPEEFLRGLEHLVTTGKILYPAASNFAAWETMRAIGIQDRHGWARLAAIQPMYNLVKRQAEVELLPMAHAEGVACLPYNPLGGGLLTGRYGTSKRPASGRLVDNAMYKNRYNDAAYYDVAERFTELAKAHGHHPVSLAIAWVAAHPAVTAPLIGPRTVAQLEPALAAVDIDLTPDSELYAAISALSPSPPPATDRNEEATSANYGSR